MRRRPPPPEMLASPIRGELLGHEHLGDRAMSLAAGQRLATGPRAGWHAPLLARLNSTNSILQEAHARLVTARGGADVGPAGEWLLDNYYVIQEHVSEVRESLPRGYYRELPELATGPLAGYPRVYELAITLISHTEGRVDLENVGRFVAAFQQGSILTLGELWAIPPMLRLGLIENVRRMTLRTVQRLEELDTADAAAERITRAAHEGRDALDEALRRFAADPPPLTPEFVARFLQRLRLEGGALPAILQIEQWITEEALSVEEARTRSTQRLARTQVGIANSITSLRTIARMDWGIFVERQSRMEAILQEDPSGFYPRMTFATRDGYRQAVERIARRTGLAEEAVARQAIDLALEAGAPREDRRTHVGYYLIDDGLPRLEELTGYRPGRAEAAHQWVRRHAEGVFVGGIALLTLAALAALLVLAGHQLREAWVIVAILGFLPALDIAVGVVNQLTTAFLPPRQLPKLDFERAGVPPEFRTAVVIPTLFASVDEVEQALENLEAQFLANREAHLHFALLSDHTDASTPSRPGDLEVEQAARDGVRDLNARYAAGRQDAFYLFHRPRSWNAQEGAWMGWERKRGKLAQFNRLVLDGDTTPFSLIVGDLAPLREVRYVITLDADTVLPPDAAPLLVGALAHPLNRAVYDEALGRVVRGYGILQPRVGVSLTSANRSVFAAIHSGHPGVDPYTTAVSDVYQDLFGEGSFTGKGVYDVVTFERAMRGRFPENMLLSHDLIEGSFARAGLATDVLVYDDYPTRYLTHAHRKHRWIRGDWQLLPWLTSWVPGPAGAEPNRLSLLSRWKLLDNLRRSLVEMALLVFLAAGWILFPGHEVRWTLLGLGAFAAPWVVALLLALVRPPRDKSWRAYYGAVSHDAVTSIQQFALALTFLPHQAWVSADAIARTLWRMAVSRRHLLEWKTASQSEQRVADSNAAVWGGMWPVVPVAALALLLPVVQSILSHRGLTWTLAVSVIPLGILWMASPSVAHVLDAPVTRPEERLPADRRRQAMRYALLHWRYFDRFAVAGTHWLVPDNFQEVPEPVVAARTSPTNIGLQLLSTVSARDLGFIPLEDLTRRLELMFATLARLPRLHGHFYNWYDLHSLEVLEPSYISTVDSGNLAGHLIAFRQACLEIIDDPVVDRRLWHALEAALALAEADLTSIDSPPEAGISVRRAQVLISSLRRETPTGAVLTEVATALRAAERAMAGSKHPGTAGEWLAWCLGLLSAQTAWVTRLGDGPGDTLRDLAARSPDAARVTASLLALADQAHRYAMSMNFRVLFDRERRLFATGFQQRAHALDTSSYDLLASEARLASFIAIAKNDVPVEHWFRLGRTLTFAAGSPALVSWSGSMFEYLMPLLVMRSYPFTLLAQSDRGAVDRQMAYAGERGVPWGISESAYNVRDRHQTYQYRAFGVPDLALKRGLERDLVVAPYATLLAALVRPGPALQNLARLEKLGSLGPYGFRDALDFTRPEPDEEYALVGAYMAHHQGMGLVALANILRGRIWPRRFHADPLVRSAELLLQERIPRRLVFQTPQRRPDDSFPDVEPARPTVREFGQPDTVRPHVALLGQLPYTVMISHCGSGYSHYGALAVTRWRSDATRDATGQFCYIRDLSTGRLWSAGHQPVCAPADRYLATLASDRVVFERVDGDVETRTEIVVVPEDHAEVRRVTLTNGGNEAREIELTSYSEVVMAPPAADRAHPAFSNLFVETAWHSWCSAITATRRPRAADEATLWCVHVVDTGKDKVGEVTCETDRARFVGRGRSTRHPQAMMEDGALSGTTGAVLDPVFALRTRVRLEPGQSTSVAFTTLVADTRERAFELADRYHDPHAALRALDLASTSSQVELRDLDLTPADVAVFQELAGVLIYGEPRLRAPQGELRRNRGSQAMLWEVGPSGNWPIVLATIQDAEGLPTLRQLLVAHRYWQRRGLTVDLIILVAHPPDYLQDLVDRVRAAVYAIADPDAFDRPGGVFLRHRDLLTPQNLLMVQATARLHLRCDGHELGRIMETTPSPEENDLAASGEEGRPAPVQRERGASRVGRVIRKLGTLLTTPMARHGRAEPPDPRGGVPSRSGNGFGELTDNGDYRVVVEEGTLPPAPWANVIANPNGGFVITERGGGFTWAENSFFYRLTPWHNDPVSDPVSDVIYLEDDESDDLWCPTPGPVSSDGSFVIQHGPGRSTFQHTHAGIETVLTVGMPEEDPVKLSHLRVTNTGSRPRRLILTTFVEWNLGVLREHSQHQVRTEFDRGRGAIFAQNTFDPQFAEWMAFHAISEPVQGFTASRQAFLGRNGTAAAPAALFSGSLDGASGAGIDPCAALRCTLELEPGETRDIAILLGAAPSGTAAQALRARYQTAGQALDALTAAVSAWEDRLSIITVHTPEPAFDVMSNRWLLYQALSCRMWGRSALYQSGGAYGFRDQLQDVAAFVYAEPGLARAHILRAAGRQFVEGDVQHWWHPQSGRGVRTRFSDDLVWLPHVVDHYVRITGDRGVLDENVPFLRMRELRPDEHEVYDLPEVSRQEGSVYEHCLRALRRACTDGAHGLPLIGIGDWNDGMNRVGVEGRGESVWLGWFLVGTLRSFAEQADERHDTTTAALFRRRADDYLAAIEAHGWDGEWYRRAWFDDGTPLGSRTSDECIIDSIAQTWSVISGAGSPARQEQAMRSLERYLVREDARLLPLLTPPFDKTTHDPGYIRGYLPGVRENGAQYTHAALWAVLATTLQGRGDRAFELFQMLNPLTHATTPEAAETYKVEPYVVAADVYAAPGHLGRGGWTWYTGSASWMYRVGLEGILGFRKRGNRLFLEPRVPETWPGYSIHYRHGGSLYVISVRQGAAPSAGGRVLLDGVETGEDGIPLVDDGTTHEVVVEPAR